MVCRAGRDKRETSLSLEGGEDSTQGRHVTASACLFGHVIPTEPKAYRSTGINMEFKIETYLVRRGVVLLVEAAIAITMTFVAGHFFSEKTLVAFTAVMILGLWLRLDALGETLADKLK